jgi:hypothetical protein
MIILKWILREIGCDGTDWFELAQNGDQWRYVVKMMNIQVEYNFGKFLGSGVSGGFSRRAQLHRVSYFEKFRIYNLGLRLSLWRL